MKTIIKAVVSFGLSLAATGCYVINVTTERGTCETRAWNDIFPREFRSCDRCDNSATHYGKMVWYKHSTEKGFSCTKIDADAPDRDGLDLCDECYKKYTDDLDRRTSGE